MPAPSSRRVAKPSASGLDSITHHKGRRAKSGGFRGEVFSRIKTAELGKVLGLAEAVTSETEQEFGQRGWDDLTWCKQSFNLASLKRTGVVDLLVGEIISFVRATSFVSVLQPTVKDHRSSRKL